MNGTLSPLNLAGKTLSQANSDRLVSITRELLELLASANIIDPKVISTFENGPTGWLPAQAAAGGSSRFVNDVERATWYSRLYAASKLFMRRFREINEIPQEWFEREYGEGVDRLVEANALVDDYHEVLASMAGQFKLPNQGESIWEAMDIASEPFRLSAISASGGESGSQDLVPINCASIEFRCRAGSKGKSKPSLGNRSQFSGVLFRVDEASEAVPSKGPGLPLYIPSTVAASAVTQVFGLPLDAADSLSEHADESIVGVMLSAEINEQDFVVHGQLWPSSQAEKVSAIAASKDELGMSLTGDAIGHEAEVDGRKVFWVDALALKGANILYARKATFQKTRLLQASLNPKLGVPNESDLPVAAAGENSTQGDDDMDIQELNTKIEALGEQINQLTSGLSEIQEERKQAQLQAQAEQSQEAKEAEQQALMKAISDQVQSAIAAAMNPSGQPRRVTPNPVAVAANGNSNGDGQMDVQLRLARLQGQLDVARETGDLTTELQLVDDIRSLGGIPTA